MAELRTRAVLLRQVDTGESDRVVTLLTEEQGRVSAIARGARKSRKRFGAALGLFVLAEATLRRRTRSGAGLYALSAYDALQTFPGISTRLGAIAHASYVTELVRELSPADQPEPGLFNLLLGAYHHLDQHPPRSASLRWLEQRVLSVAGLAPQLEACVRCGADVRSGAPEREEEGEGEGEGEGDAWTVGFDVERGGVTCGRCTHPPNRLSAAGHQALHRLARCSLQEASAMEWEAAVGDQLRRALGGVITSNLGRPLKSVEFIRKVTS